MIITDEDLHKGIASFKALHDINCTFKHCKTCDGFKADIPPIEDLMQDLLDARAQIKFLEGQQCQC